MQISGSCLPLVLLVIFSFLSYSLSIHVPPKLLAADDINSKNSSAERKTDPANALVAKFDPWLDDVHVEQQQDSLEKEFESDGNGKQLQQQRARLCSEWLSPNVTEMLQQRPPFGIYDLSCFYDGNKRKSQRRRKRSPPESAVLFWRQLWARTEQCHPGVMAHIKSKPHCQMMVGFVDHLFVAPQASLIATLSGPQFGNQHAVVRLVCGQDALDLLATLDANVLSTPRPAYSPPKESDQGDEEMFLKTLFAMEFSWHPGCIAVFFDSRTLDASKQPMGRLLLSSSSKDDGLKFGTADGQNKWAASKLLCTPSETQGFRSELHQMRLRTQGVPKELTEQQEKIREELTRKVDEEMFPVYQVTAAPPSGFFQSFWDGLTG